MKKLRILSALEHAKNLINCHSITPEDGGAQDYIIEQIAPLGFTVERINRKGVSNLWMVAKDFNPAKSLLVFAGHTDVVPPGNTNSWQSPPFEATIREGNLYGRGACDMKGPIAAMLSATQSFYQQYSEQNSKHTLKNNTLTSLAFLITSDEEGEAKDGTLAVMQQLQKRGIYLNRCLLGEPSSIKISGDAIKVGRRGSITLRLTLTGKQGHVAYPHKAHNPLPFAAKLAHELTEITWDKGDEYFPATSFNIVDISSNNDTSNLIPEQVRLMCNWRFNTQTSSQQIQDKVMAMLQAMDIKFEANWKTSAEPFLSKDKDFVDKVQQAVLSVNGVKAELNTTGGTSDGRFIAPTGCSVLELGVPNTSAHQVDEYCAVAELERLSQIYKQVLNNILK